MVSKEKTKTKTNLGDVYCEIMDKGIESDPTKGLYLQPLNQITKFYINWNELEMKIPNGIICHLTTMYLKAKGIEYELNKDREGYYVCGITYKNNSVSQLADTLKFGLKVSPETKRERERLYNEIF